MSLKARRGPAHSDDAQSNGASPAQQLHTTMREVIPPATPQLTAVKLVQHAISCLEADDRQTSLATLKVLLSILSRLDGYLDAMSTEGPASLAPLIHETLHHDWAKVYAEKKTSYPVTPQWSAGAYEGGFVAMVARAIGAKRVLEVREGAGWGGIMHRASLLPCLPDWHVHRHHDALCGRGPAR